MSKLSELKGVNIRSIAKVPDTVALIVDIHGPEQGGKSHFAAKAIGKRGGFYQTLEPHQSNPTVKKVAAETGAEIMVAEYKSEIPPELDRADGGAVQKYFKAQLGTFRTDLQKVLKAAPGATIVWDKANNLWEVIRFAHFGKLTQVPAIKYAQANADFADMVIWPRAVGSTLIMLNEEEELWETKTDAQGNVKREATGKMRPHAQKSTGYLSDLRLRAWKTPPPRDSRGQATGSTTFNLTVVECRANPDLIGETFQNVSWQELCVMVKPELDPDTWL